MSVSTYFIRCKLNHLPYMFHTLLSASSVACAITELSISLLIQNVKFY
jgi:hypothetical protein